MKKTRKIILEVFIIFVVLFISLSVLTLKQYNLSPLEFIKYSLPLSEEESAYLEEKDTIYYGMDSKAPPLTFTNEQTEQNEGLLVDYMSAISVELGVNVAYRASSFNEIMDLLKEDEVDMSDLFESTERLKTYAFTQPLYRLCGIAVSLKDRSDIAKIENLEGMKVAIVEDDFANEFFSKLKADRQIHADIISVIDTEEGLKLLASGKIDALAGDETVIEYYTAKLAMDEVIKELDDPLYEKNVTFAVNKQNKILLNILSKGILTLKKKIY